MEVDNLDNKLQMKTDQWRQKCELCAHSTHGRYWIQSTGLVEVRHLSVDFNFWLILSV